VTHILVVDDEPSFRTFAALVLEIAGHQTTLAAYGLEAPEAPGPFDLLLTDVMMPRMMGDELARRMRQRDPTVKVLYLTGTRRSCKDGGMLLAGESRFEETRIARVAGRYRFRCCCPDASHRYLTQWRPLTRGTITITPLPRNILSAENARGLAATDRRLR
jgi:CheY-like chemotaxis protein